METTTVKIEFIKEAHKSACEAWKAKIENEFPDLFKSQLEVNKWYKCKKALVFVNKEIKRHSIIGYGFTGDENWTDNWHYSNNELNPLVIATESEIESALIAEAKRRGYTKKNTKCLFGKIHQFNPDFSKWYFCITRNRLYTKPCGEGGSLIFDSGVWAKIIQEPTEKELLQKQLNEIQEKINKL